MRSLSRTEKNPRSPKWDQEEPPEDPGPSWKILEGFLTPGQSPGSGELSVSDSLATRSLEAKTEFDDGREYTSIIHTGFWRLALEKPPRRFVSDTRGTFCKAFVEALFAF